MRPTTKALVALLSVCLFFSTFGPMAVPAYRVTDIDGAHSVDIIFDKAGERTVNLSIPQPFKALSASMNVSGGPTIPGGAQFPKNVSIDVGADGKAEWVFDGPGHGPLGRQDRFSDGANSTDMVVNGPTSHTYDLQVPRDAVIESAGMTLTGVPTPTQKITGSAVNESLNVSGEGSYHISGIKDTDIAINSSVQLKDVAVVQNKVDVNQSASGQNIQLLTNVFSAQSFRINRTDPKQTSVDLYSVEVGFNDPGSTNWDVDLDIYNTSGASDYKPVGNYIDGGSANYNAWKNGYVNFTFLFPVKLEPDRVYSLVFGRHITGEVMPYLQYHEQTGGTNADSKYPVPGCYMHVTTDNGQTWTTYHERDWAFRTHVGKARPATAVELGHVKVDGRAPTSIIGATSTFDGNPRYNASGWNITVRNDNPLDVLYNISSYLNFNDAPDHVALDIGADSVDEFKYDGNLTTSSLISNLNASVASAAQAAVGLGKNQTDAYGNELVTVPIKISCYGKGHLALGGLFVLYNHLENVPGLKTAIESYQASHGGAGPLNIPLKVKSSTPGVVRLSGANIVYDGPPVQVRKAPAGLSIPEEGMNATIMDLEGLFEDDFDTDLVLAVHNVSTSSALNGTLNVSVGPTMSLSIDARKALNWSGLVTVIVNATERNGFIAESGPINITVTPVNDAPVIASIPPRNATVGKPYQYNFTVVDSDSLTFNIWLEKAPLSMELDRPNRSILWTPGQSDIGEHGFQMKVSDGQLEARQNITIMVNRSGGGGGGNRQPIVQAIANRSVEVGGNLSFQVLATDADLDALFYYVVSGPGGLTVNNTTGMVKWRPDAIGNYTATVRVSDGLLWAEVIFNITVVAKGALIGKPNVTIDRPTGGERVTGILTLLGKASVKGTKITKVEYSIDGGPWAKADLLPDGSWSAEESAKNLTKGNHTVVVRATDATGQIAQTFTTFTIQKGGGSKPTGLSMMAVLPYIFLLILVVAGVLLAVSLSRSKAGKGAKAAKGSKAKLGKSAAEGKAVETAVEKGVPSSPVDSAFLVYHDGRLITYHSRSAIEDLDATLQVIKDFVKASFRGDVGRLDALRYENMNIILERGIQMYLVVITPEEDDLVLQGLRRRMRSFLGDVHERYRHILKVWDGKYKSVKPIERMVEEYVDGKWSHGEVSAVKGEVHGKEETEESPIAKDEAASKRWDESPDLDGSDLSRVEKQKKLQDKLTRGEITEAEFEKLKSKL